MTDGDFTACPLCAPVGFTAAAGEAHAAPIKRAILQCTDGPAPGYETLIVLVQIEPNAVVPRHTHPGVESGYVVEGEAQLTIDGQPSRTLTAGQTFQMPNRVPHWQKAGEKGLRAIAIYVVEKGQPLTSSA